MAYDSLLVSRRQALHAAAGRALETLYADRLEDVYDRLAYHYSKTDQAAKAVEYLIRFAEKVAQTYAHADAVTALQEAMAHVDQLPAAEQDRRRLEIIIRLAHSLYFLGRVPETLDILLQHQETLERLGDPTLAGPFYFWLGHTYSYLSVLDRAVESSERAIEEAKRCADESTLGKAYYVLARSRGFWLCYFPEGVEYTRQGVELLERTREWFWLGQSYWAMAMNDEFMGEFEPGLEAASRGHAIGERSGDLRVQTYNEWITGWLSATRGDWEAGIEWCQKSLSRSRDAFNTAASTGWLGHAYLEKGDSARAIPLLERAMDDLRRYGYLGIIGWFSVWLSEVLLLDNQIERARDVAAEGLEIAQDVKNWWGSASNQRVLGQIALARGDLVEAATDLNQALTTFTSIHSRFDEGKTRLALAELAHRQGDREAAANHLHEAVSLFTVLHAPRYVERAEHLASGFGISDVNGSESTRVQSLLDREGAMLDSG